jgi:hypothetical protein
MSRLTGAPGIVKLVKADVLIDFVAIGPEQAYQTREERPLKDGRRAVRITWCPTPQQIGKRLTFDEAKFPDPPDDPVALERYSEVQAVVAEEARAFDEEKWRLVRMEPRPLGDVVVTGTSPGIGNAPNLMNRE